MMTQLRLFLDGNVVPAVQVAGAEDCKLLLAVLNRALNTWPEADPKLFKLCDDLTEALSEV